MGTASLLAPLESFFCETAPLAPGDAIVVAFSGGPDSTALLLGLSQIQIPHVQITAAHLDHGLDEGSAGRAVAAARIAERLGVPCVSERREVHALRQPGESTEAAARRIRYGFLEEIRERLGARWIATAHHQDDQAETVLLRLLFGSGLAGLAGIRPVQGRIVRPLLEVPRAVLREAVEAAGISWIDDPTNRDLSVPRNLVRHRVLPALEEPSPAALARLAVKARRAGSALDRRLEALLAPRRLDDGVAVDRRALRKLPEELLPFALALLHRWAGAPYPAGSPARMELARQLGRTGAGRLACDGGGGWRWEETADGSLALRRPGTSRMSMKPLRFTYTLEVPGRIEIPELGLRVGLHHHPVEPWMFQGSPHRAGLALPLAAGDRVTVRNRRPGDRLHPLGAAGSRRLKEVLIDRRVPQGERDRIPLFCVGERIAWVPGVTIDQRFRITGEAAAWVAEVETR
jgi:tRNA(Ile)-lysidine synthase